MDELKTIEQELNSWSDILNIAVGAPSLAFALACASLPEYINLIGCAISIAMWISLMAYARPSFSRKLQELRLRQDKDERAREIIKFSEENFLSNYKFSPYLLGSLSLVLVAGYSYLSVLLKLLFP
ncbi:hypothetical protein [Stutzerimonas stutzeri]|uniref:Uncharacterized protein n=1 Tax=Stutzerimonas stutzeri RCH2 TaxID=644801 RepID=L0GD59_STUST|nr:hypothetical protein [Stutzerimonas stutzeri]AGA84658.1 hypothetical protein Psest_0045 [Stutzerimonas stutzeri RCH2]